MRTHANTHAWTLAPTHAPMHPYTTHACVVKRACAHAQENPHPCTWARMQAHSLTPPPNLAPQSCTHKRAVAPAYAYTHARHARKPNCTYLHPPPRARTHTRARTHARTHACTHVPHARVYMQSRTQTRTHILASPADLLTCGPVDSLAFVVRLRQILRSLCKTAHYGTLMDPRVRILTSVMWNPQTPKI